MEPRYEEVENITEEEFFTPVNLRYRGIVPMPEIQNRSYIICHPQNTGESFIFGAEFVFLVEDTEGKLIESTLPISVYHRDWQNRIFVPFHFCVHLPFDFYNNKEIIRSLDFVYFDENTNGVYTVAIYRDKREIKIWMTSERLAYREALMDPSIAAMVLHSGERLLTRTRSYTKKNFDV